MIPASTLTRARTRAALANEHGGKSAMPTAKARRNRDVFDVSHLAAEGAERQVLAGVLDILDRDPAAGREIVTGMTVEMFSGSGTGDVFKAVRDVLLTVQEPTVADVLGGLRASGHERGTLAHTLLVDLVADRIGTGPQAARLAREAAVEVRQLHERRQAIEAASLVVQSGGHPDDIGVLVRHLERVRTAADAAAGSRPMTLLDCIDAWAKHERRPTVATGLRWFDRPTDGGLPIGGIVALVAYPQVGKSALALQLSLAALVTDPTLRSVWALGEMAPHGIGGRMACVAAGLLPDCEPVTMDDAARRSKAARSAAVALANVVGDRMAIVPAPLTVDAIEARVAATGARLCVVDYLQLIRSRDGASDRVQELDAIIGRLRDMAINRECAVIVISSMAKSAGTTSRIGQFGKGTGEIDYAVEMLYVGEVEEHNGTPDIAPDGTVGVAWRCKKARNLEPRDLVLRFDGATQIYSDESVSYSPPANGHADFDAFAPRAGL
jgi:replicative DNA helicase